MSTNDIRNCNVVLAQDAGQVTQNTGGFEPIPLVDTVFVMTSAELLDTKDGTGKYVNAQFSVAQENGSHIGRVIFHKFHVQNRNPKAVQIGVGQLKALCSITCGTPPDGQQFTLAQVAQALNIPFIGRPANEKELNQKGEVDQKIGSFKCAFNAMNQGVSQNHGAAPPPNNNAPPTGQAQIQQAENQLQQGYNQQAPRGYEQQVPPSQLNNQQPPAFGNQQTQVGGANQGGGQGFTPPNGNPNQ